MPKPVQYRVKPGEKKPKAQLITISNTTPNPPPKKELLANESKPAPTTGKHDTGADKDTPAKAKSTPVKDTASKAPKAADSAAALGSDKDDETKGGD